MSKTVDSLREFDDTSVSISSIVLISNRATLEVSDPKIASNIQDISKYPPVYKHVEHSKLEFCCTSRCEYRVSRVLHPLHSAFGHVNEYSAFCDWVYAGGVAVIPIVFKPQQERNNLFQVMTILARLYRHGNPTYAKQPEIESMTCNLRLPMPIGYIEQPATKHGGERVLVRWTCRWELTFDDLIREFRKACASLDCAPHYDGKTPSLEDKSKFNDILDALAGDLKEWTIKEFKKKMEGGDLSPVIMELIADRFAKLLKMRGPWLITTQFGISHGETVAALIEKAKEAFEKTFQDEELRKYEFLLALPSVSAWGDPETAMNSMPKEIIVLERDECGWPVCFAVKLGEGAAIVAPEYRADELSQILEKLEQAIKEKGFEIVRRYATSKYSVELADVKGLIGPGKKNFTVTVNGKSKSIASLQFLRFAGLWAASEVDGGYKGALTKIEKSDPVLKTRNNTDFPCREIYNDKENKNPAIPPDDRMRIIESVLGLKTEEINKDVLCLEENKKRIPDSDNYIEEKLHNVDIKISSGILKKLMALHFESSDSRCANYDKDKAVFFKLLQHALKKRDF